MNPTPTMEPQPQPVAENAPDLSSNQRNTMPVRYSIRLSIVLDVIIAVGLLGLFVQGFFYTGPDSGFATILGFMYVIIAIIPTADGYILYRSSRRIINRRLCSYWAISRSLVLLATVYSFYQYAAYGSTLEKSSAFGYTATIIAISLLFGCTGVIFYRAVKGRRQLVLLMFMAGASLLSAGYINLAVAQSNQRGVGGGLAGTRRDNQTARDFQLLSQDVENYALSGKFPTSLRQAISDPNGYGSQASIDSRLNRYVYKYDNATGKFQLCATFSTDTTNSDIGGAGVTKAYKHKVGYQCFSFEVTGWSNGHVPTKSSGQGQSSQNQGVQIYNLNP